MRPTLASLLFAISLTACGDRVITVPVPAPTTTPAGATSGMTVTGSAVLEVSPDCADITMTIDVLRPRPGAATAAAQSQQTAMIAALKAIGVEAGDVELSTLSLQPVYDWVREVSVFKGYRAAITITATTKQFDQIGPIMEVGSNNGATQISSQFRRSDLAALKAEVRAMALAAAKAKAKQTADALELALGPVISVAESTGGAMWTHAYFPNSHATASRPGAASAVLGGTAQPLSLDVTIVYALPRET